MPGTPVAQLVSMTDSRLEADGLSADEEVAAMGGPWRERGFDVGSLRAPRPSRGAYAQAMARSREEEGLGRIVLVYITAVVTAFGLMLAVLQQGW
jgi:hypothetical protein